jgi:hypothetical protein
MEETILDYLIAQKQINNELLKVYESISLPESDPVIRRMRETERIRISDRINELTRHIEAIKSILGRS